MGAIADGIVAYAQPLIDSTDGSPEELKKAFAMTQLCFNLSLLPEDDREKQLSEMRSTLGLDDEEFHAFRRSIIDPMIRRHQEMFPLMHQRASTNHSQSSPALRAQPQMAAPGKKYPGTAPYAPCPCNSGEKYKFCCGARGR
jgi:uncharacterized protein YecA (UPF0149 family)